MKNFRFFFLIVVLFSSLYITAQVTLEKEVKVTDLAMFFNGKKVPITSTENSTTGYDYVYGNALTPHGDCIKTYKQYVFMTWYRGGKEDRHVMLTRYNTETDAMKTIEFPHQHTGYRGLWWLGETHNTIAIGISPLDGTIHMVYDMHGYSNSGAFVNDYFRYSYSVSNAAELSDDEFTLDKFIKDPIDGDYRHATMDGKRNPGKYDRFTYPQFFLNDDGELFLTARDGTSHDGAQAFIKYDESAKKWGDFYYFNALQANSKGETHDWSIYGSMKYVDGKIRIGFQRRLRNSADKYNAQNGVYYAYSDDPTGATQWKNHKGEAITFPIVKAEETLIFEPGDLVETQARNQVHIVSGFDWTVTDNGDVHIISRVADRENNITKNIHSYKPNGENNFIISTDFEKASNIYTSGNNIFVIGLNSAGRPFIDVAEGGTNFFTRAYEQTSGKRFSKGQVYISEGKLYYYLLENNSSNNDDSRTTYLQIIDLDIQIGPKPFAVNLVSPSNNQEFKEGRSVQLQALATADEGEITKVQFLVNDEMVNEDTSKPFTFSWLPVNIGSYKVKAIAYKTGGASITSSEATIQVIEVDKSDLTDDVYRLQNVSTGKFLGDDGGSANPISMKDKGEETNTHWRFVKTTVSGEEYYNIDSETNGILRATGSGFAAGANLVVSTGKGSPAEDSDKIWTIHYNELDNTFRFESKDNDRYLYHDEDENVYNVESDESDQRSVWKAIPVGQVLSISNELVSNSSVQIYPNPAKNNFTISLKNIETAGVEIYNILGKSVYKESTTEKIINIDKTLKSGVYLVKLFTKNKKKYYSKLIVR